MTYLKYLITFLVTVAIFSFTGFYPTDCSNESTAANCTVTGNDACSFNGIELKGRVQFVESFPDIKIQLVESFPDIKVKLVESYPDDCGEWQVVESFPDFKVQIVESFPDLKVKYVESFPGME
jgi:hypothetical protein